MEEFYSSTISEADRRVEFFGMFQLLDVHKTKITPPIGSIFRVGKAKI